MSEIYARSGGEREGTTLSRYMGCMRSFHINGATYPLTVGEGIAGANIIDCDGTACGGDICENNGVCVLTSDQDTEYYCQCQDNFTGQHCQVLQ